MAAQDRGMQSGFESWLGPPAELLSRIRTAVAATPVSIDSTRLRTTVAIAVVRLVTAAVLLMVSKLTYHRPALRIEMGTYRTGTLMIVLLLSAD
jgi:hypothetical protein